MEFYEEITEIKKGDRSLRTAKTSAFYIKGKIYESFKDNSLSDESLLPLHEWTIEGINKHFLKIKPETENKVTESDLIGDIEGFPIEVVQKMCEEQVLQGGKFDSKKFQEERRSGFTWDQTEDGWDFWSKVIDEENFSLFFEKYPKDVIKNTSNCDTKIDTPEYYDNSKGSLYKIGKERNWDAYQQDLIKRIDRIYKKGVFASDITKSKALLDLWLSEVEEEFKNQTEKLK